MNEILLKLRAAVIAKRAADDAIYALAESLAGHKLERVEPAQWCRLDAAVSHLNDFIDGTVDITEENVAELQTEWKAI